MTVSLHPLGTRYRLRMPDDLWRLAHEHTFFRWLDSTAAQITGWPRSAGFCTATAYLVSAATMRFMTSCSPLEMEAQPSNPPLALATC